MSAMVRLGKRLAPVVLLLAALGPPETTCAQSTVLSASGTAILDAFQQPGEWDAAARVDFLVSLPAGSGGSTTPATLYVMNDGDNVYFGLGIEGIVSQNLQVYLLFDNDNDGGEPLRGDDAYLLPYSDRTFVPSFSCPPGVPLGCLVPDVEVGGTQNGSGGVSFDSLRSFYELAHPLDSSDDANDFSLGEGDAVGFELFLTTCTAVFCADTHLVCYDLLITPPPPALALDLSVSQGRGGGDFAAGDTLVVGAFLDDPGINTIVDLFFGVLLADGHTVITFLDSELHPHLGDLSDLTSLAPMVRNLDLSEPFHVELPMLLEYRRSGAEPEGFYTFFLMAALPQSLAFSRIDPGDIVALATRTASFEP
jgi:hypothetical protein